MPEQTDKQAIAAAVGGLLTVDLEHSDRVRFTVDEMADRVHERERVVEEVLDRMVDGDELPLERDGSEYVVSR